MTAWYARLPLHRKLITLALAVSTAGLLVAVVGLTLFDVWRYRTRAGEDATTLASLIAENTAAAVSFADTAAAREIVSTVRVRSAVTRGCIYLEDGPLFASYTRDPATSCPASAPVAARFHIGSAQPIVRNGEVLGTVFVEREFRGGLAARVAVTSAAAAVMLVLASALAFILARRLARGVAGPVVRLAAEARRVGRDPDIPVPDIPAAQDEVGDLVRAFQSMLLRVREANAGLMAEIEERKKVEAEREALLERERETSRLKDEFVATVSHELRTPMGVILSWSQILEATRPDEATLAKAVSAISRCAGEQARIIDDLVDISRITTGKLHLRWQIVDLREPVQASLEAVRTEAAAKDVRVSADLPDRRAPVNGDADRLRQLVGNLLSNAVKFTDRGGRVSVALAEMPTAYEIVVTDSGIGIAPDVLPHVFDRYRQADSSTTRAYGGLGLGLSIVKELSEQHGGSVVMESEGVGRGATARVRLPRLGAHEERAARVPRSTPVSPVPTLDGIRVLAVDDNVEALDGLATTLRSAGATVETATSGAQAIERWARDPADVLICDLAMPHVDGFAVVARVREIDRQRDLQTVAIAVSAHATPEHRRRSTDAGFATHVAKPYRMTELIGAIHDALTGSTQERT